MKSRTLMGDLLIAICGKSQGVGPSSGGFCVVTLRRAAPSLIPTAVVPSPLKMSRKMKTDDYTIGILRSGEKAKG